MGTGCDNLGDLHEVQVHRLGIAGRQDQGRALALFRADRTEDVGGGGALVPGRAGTGTALAPVSANPASSDGASATVRTRRSKGSLLDAGPF